MSSKLKPVIWSHGTGQWIACFDGCQLAMVCMSNRKDTLYALYIKVACPISSRLAAMLCIAIVIMHWAHVIHATSHLDHEKLSKHACGSVSIVTGFSLAELCC